VHARFGRGAEAAAFQRWAVAAVGYDAKLATEYQVYLACMVQDGWLSLVIILQPTCCLSKCRLVATC
jgi:hypothetical protein